MGTAATAPRQENALTDSQERLGQRRLPVVTVAICTFQRPEMLRKLLTTLADQDTGSSFTMEVRIVDNDWRASSLDVVQACRSRISLPIEYVVEPRQNIALARNKAVEGAEGDFLAFIDDDEVPARGWLLGLFRTIEATGADAALGPVLPHFPARAPAWLKQSRVCYRANYETGRTVSYQETRTGNALLRRALISGDPQPFREDYGCSGGEDIEFFRRKASDGARYVWCREAAVYETIPPDRWTLPYYTRRQFRLGSMLAARRPRNSLQTALGVSRVTGALIWNAARLAISLPFGKARYALPLVKVAYHAGYISSAMGCAADHRRPEMRAAR